MRRKNPRQVACAIVRGPANANKEGKISMTHQRARDVIGPVFAFIFFTMLLAGANHALAGKPSITWSPSRIEATIGNGTEVTRDSTITVSSSATLTDVDLWIVPELSGFLSLEPSHFATMTAGATYNVEVHLTVPPGATPGSYDGTVHVRSGSQTIPQTLKVLINLDYGDISIPSSTCVLSDATTRYLTAVADDSLTFSTTTDELQQLASADVIVVGITSLTPGGLLRKVTGVRSHNGDVVVDTSAATIEDAIQNGSLHISEILAPSDVAAAVATRKGVVLHTDSTTRPRDLTGFYIEINDVVLYDHDHDTNTEYDQIRADGSVSIDPQFDFTLDVQDLKLKQASFVCTIKQASELGIKAELELASVERKYEIARFYLNPMIVWAGWVPVVIEPILTVNVGVDGSVSVGITASVKEELTAKAGLAYDSGSWSPISDLSIDFTYSEPALSAGCDFKGYAGPQLSLLIYGVVGPYADFNGYLNLQADIFDTPWWELYGGFEVGAGVRVEVLTHQITDYYDPEVIGYRELLAQATTPPPPPPGNPTLYVPGGSEITIADTYRRQFWSESCGYSGWCGRYQRSIEPGWHPDPGFSEYGYCCGGHGGCSYCIMTISQVLANYQTEVTFLSRTPGARIFIDGAEWWPGAVTGATFRGVAPGHHTYELKLDGVVIGSGAFELAEGTPITVY